MPKYILINLQRTVFLLLSSFLFKPVFHCSQEAVLLTMAPRLLYMMGAGRQVRAVLGTPTIQTHHHGKKQSVDRHAMYTIKQSHIPHFILLSFCSQGWWRIWVCLWRRALSVSSRLWRYTQPSDSWLPRSALPAGQPSVQSSDSWDSCHVRAQSDAQGFCSNLRIC